MNGDLTPEELKIILNSLVAGYANAGDRLQRMGKLTDAQINASARLDQYYISEKRKILGVVDELDEKVFVE